MLITNKQPREVRMVQNVPRGVDLLRKLGITPETSYIILSRSRGYPESFRLNLSYNALYGEPIPDTVLAHVNSTRVIYLAICDVPAMPVSGLTIFQMIYLIRNIVRPDSLKTSVSYKKNRFYK